MGQHRMRLLSVIDRDSSSSHARVPGYMIVPKSGPEVPSFSTGRRVDFPPSPRQGKHHFRANPPTQARKLSRDRTTSNDSSRRPLVTHPHHLVFGTAG